jgi:hypothetical protein
MRMIHEHRAKARPSCCLARFIVRDRRLDLQRRVDVEQVTDLFKEERAVALPAEQSFLSFDERTSAVGLWSVEVGLENVYSVHQDREIQLSQRFHPEESRAIGEGLSWKIF